MVKPVLFDCDGVLINSEELAFTVERELMAEYGLHYEPAYHIENFTGRSYEALMARLNEDYRALNGGKELPDMFMLELHERYELRVRDRVKAISGVAGLLTSLKEAGIPYAVASNSNRAGLHRKLKNADLLKYFEPEHIFSCDDVPCPKPAPDMFLLAAKTLGEFEPENCIVIEDSITGASAGLACGMHVIGFTEGGHRPASYPAAMLKAGLVETAPTMEDVKRRIFELNFLPVPLAQPPAAPPQKPANPRPPAP
jgi:HAD superfamily hydrolase (TIGR01509 family)